MKQVKLITTTIFCLFLVLNIIKHVEASDVSASFENMAPSYIEDRVSCTMADGTHGVIPDCVPSKGGTCKLGIYRECGPVD